MESEMREQFELASIEVFVAFLAEGDDDVPVIEAFGP
jgi:hypothetical protein